MKYIIEIENARYVNGSSFKDDILYRAKGFKSLVFDKSGLERLTPYTEPDKNVKNNDVHLCNSCVCDFPCCLASEEDVSYGDSEGFDNICCCPHYIPKNYYNPESKERKAIEDEVWEFAREICSINFEDYMKCFGIYDVMEGSAFTKYTYQKAKTKYEEWKNRNIRVGDEVYTSKTNDGQLLDRGVVVGFGWESDSEAPKVLSKSGSLYGYLPKDRWTKTGRFFPEVEELLKKMKGE